ncbi:MAG TPA: SBBP repeat-containing protein, partial [Saprospiraceae bacterium]|nr:SBBP repeat-containing protein [Saprospiraceae bacterium]
NSLTERGYGIAVDADGNAYVTGETSSSDFLVAGSNLIQPYLAGGDDAFVTKISSGGPGCSKAKPSIALLWPPKHYFVPISIQGVTDSEGNPLTIRVDSMRQDEAVNAKGSGHTAPDGQGIGTSTAQVRAERVGDQEMQGNGRVYHISFTAENDQGGSCKGEVRVGIPYDQGQGATPVDEGALYDSTVVPTSYSKITLH